jgi:hypothetical protein
MLFKVARDSAISIKAPAREGGQTPALVSIVFSVAALEAFLNEISELALEAVLDNPDVICVLGEFLADAERSHASLESKFAVGSWILSGKKFDRGAQSYQNFSLLMRLRNDLVHFKTNDSFEQEVTPEEIHKNLVSRFKDKNILAENIRSENELGSWTFLVKTKAVAEWSCRTASHMIGEFCAKLPRCGLSLLVDHFANDLNPQKLFPSA